MELNSVLSLIAIFCWISFIVAVVVAVIESKPGSRILRHGGGAVFIWIFSPYTDEGIRTNTEIVILWARVSFALGIGAAILKVFV